MSYLSLEFMRKVEMGLVDKWTFVRKFGRSTSVSTTLAPVVMTNKYPTPKNLTSLELVSSSANDTSGGSGARTVTVIGLSTGYVETTEVVTMNGVTPVALANQYYRVYRMYVTTSGTYASSTNTSHDGTITLRESGAGASWFQMVSDGGLGLGQSLIGAYTIPDGYTGYVYLSYITVESTKSASLFFFAREGIDTVAAPYTPMRIRAAFDASSQFVDFNGSHFMMELPERSDVGFMAKTASGTAAVAVEFKVYLKRT